MSEAKPYTRKIEEQICQYATTEKMHDQLSDIFTYWQRTCFRQRFRDVCLANNHIEFYSNQFSKKILSTGCKNLNP